MRTPELIAKIISGAAITLQLLNNPTPVEAGNPVLSGNHLRSPEVNYQGCIFYTVRPGDTLTKIAAKYGVTVEMLKIENGLNTVTANYITVGQQLCIPTYRARANVVAGEAYQDLGNQITGSVNEALASGACTTISVGGVTVIIFCNGEHIIIPPGTIVVDQ